MAPLRITPARIDALTRKLDAVITDINKMTIGDTRAADAERIKQLAHARGEIGLAKAILKEARPK